jgi:integrase
MNSTLTLLATPQEPGATSPAGMDASLSWKSRYGAKHRLQRVHGQPGIDLPKRVRIYRRADHFVLQWWEGTQGRTLNKRVEGDFITAISKAREIDDRLAAFKTSGQAGRRITLCNLLELYFVDLDQRADAGEISPATAKRYKSALAHLLAFAKQPAIERTYSYAHQVDRKFRLSLAAHLQQASTAKGGRENGAGASSSFILEACRMLFAWAADPKRGAHLGEGFLNAFESHHTDSTTVRTLHLGEPDITLEMAVTFIGNCDAFQLRLFSTILAFGLRPSEITFLYHENQEDGWLHVKCIPEISYFAKGRRDKRFPLLEPLRSLIGRSSSGLVFKQRDWHANQRITLAEAVREFEATLKQTRKSSAVDRLSLRDRILRKYGCLDYDRIEKEFQSVADPLNWPKAATLKDFRHLFSTCLENAGVPEFYRKFLMGQSPGRSAIVSYTHLNRLQDHYSTAMNSEFAIVLRAISNRLEDIRTIGPAQDSTR